MAIANTASAGMVTPKMVVKRARELAAIKGRNPHDVSDSDLNCAKRELKGRTHPPKNSSKKPSRQRKIFKGSAVVAIYKSHLEAEMALKELHKEGFNMKKLSIVGRDYHTEEQVIGFYNQGDRMKYWGKTGAFWGAAWGFIFGSAFLLVPGIGPLVMAGPVVTLIVGVLEGAAIGSGLSIIGAGLCSLGIPEDSVVKYEKALKTGKFLVIAHGTLVETSHAVEIIQRTKPDVTGHHR